VADKENYGISEQDPKCYKKCSWCGFSLTLCSICFRVHISGGNHFVKTADELGELLAVFQNTKGS